MFLDITEFVKDPKYFPVVVVQPNGKDFIVGMDCDGEYVFKCVEKAVYEDVDLFKDFIMRMYYTLEGKLNRNTLKGKKEMIS